MTSLMWFMVIKIWAQSPHRAAACWRNGAMLGNYMRSAHSTPRPAAPTSFLMGSPVGLTTSG
eukprot:5982561-Prorocentrum_lima.AAC.1